MCCEYDVDLGVIMKKISLCPMCDYLYNFAVSFKFDGFYDVFTVDKGNHHFLDADRYLDEIGVMPTRESIIAVNNYNQLLMCYETAVAHYRYDHGIITESGITDNHRVIVNFVFSNNQKLKLKWFLQKRGLLIPVVKAVDDNFGNISFTRSRITDCNYFIQPINQTAAKCVSV